MQFAGGLGFVESYVCYFQLLLALQRILILCSISIIFMEDVMPPGQEKKNVVRMHSFWGSSVKEISIPTTRCCMCIDKSFGRAQGPPWTIHSFIYKLSIFVHDNKRTIGKRNRTQQLPGKNR